MHPAQILLLGLVLVSVCAHECMDGKKLEDAAKRKLKKLSLPPEALPSKGVPNECPLDLYRLHADVDLRERSLSPWEYELVTLEDHFPPSYIGARCLCHGCIRISESGNVLQDPSFNSATVPQSRPFLKKTRCTDEPGYRLEHVTVDVPVGCTCVRPNTVTS
ncbi:interleukin-17C [Parambassis ranga]|uniref:Interleukin-17C n=1 Tax=Parambassis ranga TaxID=210632 RepID=A0A6P7KDG6_9TELE|nr:interleukin-17C-like [Parambassis ranga]